MRKAKLLAAVLAVGIWGLASGALAQQEGPATDSQQQPPAGQNGLGAAERFWPFDFRPAGKPGQTARPRNRLRRRTRSHRPPAPPATPCPTSRRPTCAPNGSGGPPSDRRRLLIPWETIGRVTRRGAAAASRSAQDQGSSPPAAPPASPPASSSDSSAAGTPEASLHEAFAGVPRLGFQRRFARQPTRRRVRAAAPAPSGSGGTSGGNQTPTLAPPRPAGAASPSSRLTTRHRRLPRQCRRPRRPSPSPAAGSRLIGRIDQVGQNSQPAATSGPVAEPKSEPAGEGDPGVLIARKSPVLSVQTKGPRHIAIGKEAAYEVQIQNAGEVAAEEVVVFVGLPESADIAGVEASAGTSRVSPPRQRRHVDPMEPQPLGGQGAGEVGAAAGAPAEPALRPGGPLGLQGGRLASHDRGAGAETGPPPGGAVGGPYGKKEVFKLKLSNSGNGAAENVLLTLLPAGQRGQSAGFPPHGLAGRRRGAGVGSGVDRPRRPAS